MSYADVHEAHTDKFDVHFAPVGLSVCDLVDTVFYRGLVMGRAVKVSRESGVK